RGRGTAVTDVLHLDTHVLVWMYSGDHDRFPAALRQQLNTSSLRYSPMVRLELVHLYEIGRLTEPAGRILAELESAVGLTEDTQPFHRVIDMAERTTFARDAFDRIIIAQALSARATLATKDERIRSAYPAQTLWS